MTERDEKQAIEEIVRITKEHCELDNGCGSCSYATCNECLSEILYNAGYRKQSEIVTEIVGIINKRIEINQYHLQGNNTDLFHGIYQGRYEAYRDIAEIIEQRYGAKMKGGAE